MTALRTTLFASAAFAALTTTAQAVAERLANQPVSA